LSISATGFAVFYFCLPDFLTPSAHVAAHSLARSSIVSIFPLIILSDISAI
jgi:hypothetical protein